MSNKRTFATIGANAGSALEEVSAKGAFARTDATFRDTVEANPDAKYPAAVGRYHLYVAYACPWAHRCLVARVLKGLENVVSVSVVHPTWQRTHPEDPDDKHCGWAFKSPDDPNVSQSEGHGSFSCEGCVPDTVNGCASIRDLYVKAGYAGSKFSVPVLWDKETSAIVSNESSEIIRCFNTAFNAFAEKPELDLYPPALASAIDAVNEFVYPNLNNGVYMCGFAKSQGAYDEASEALGGCLARMEGILSKQRFLAGSVFTEADLRAFVTLARFDEVYVVYFKTNMGAGCLRNYPNLRNYVREIYQMPGVAPTVNMAHIKMHYFTSHPHLNPFAIIPTGSKVLEDLVLPHDRDRF
mmetsp:Transcript_84770/g.164431  ORF Transcript_84770/g.164431 Transcript_84770/m.164431 type:complete len:354 (+) Transcript_84770:183-1244(+)